MQKFTIAKLNQRKTLQALSVTFLTAAMLLISPAAHAARQYKCNGRVQYSPCQESKQLSNKVTISLMNTQRNAVRASLKRPAQPESKYAEIKKTSLRKLPMREGQWRGLVSGKGDIHLNLQFLRNGKVEATKYMGHVLLANKETNFSFITTLPKGEDWSWRVLAMAR